MDRAKSSTTNLDLKNRLYLSYNQISLDQYDIKPNIMEIHSRLLKDP